VADPRAFMRETVAASCDTVEPHALGTLLVTPSLSAVYGVNGIIVEGPQPDLALDDLARLFDERFSHGRYASALFWDEPTGARIEEQARERGWKVEHELIMELRRDPDRIVDTSGVREGREDEMRALADRWFAEDFPDVDEEELRQLSEYAGREWHARPARTFVAADGQAMCKLWSDGSIAQVEDVYTAPEARGGGHARALVTRAILEAREGDHELVFIVADADDTPKQLYERLGFDAREVHTRVVRKR
jgi:GNAT superfamily N-acetyltransferase